MDRVEPAGRARRWSARSPGRRPGSGAGAPRLHVVPARRRRLGCEREPVTATRTELDIHDMVRELTEPHSNRETYVHEDAATGTVWEGMAHITAQPSLVDQLLLITSDTKGSGSQAGSVPGSRPALSVEAIDLVMMIDDEAGRWVERLGENAPVDRVDNRLLPIRGSGTKARIRRVHALYPATESCNKAFGR